MNEDAQKVVLASLGKGKRKVSELSDAELKELHQAIHEQVGDRIVVEEDEPLLFEVMNEFDRRLETRNAFWQRLTRSFVDLESQGIMAKQDWLCCTNCGHAAARKERAKTYVFYHGQAADSLRELIREGRPEEVWLNWGGNGEAICKTLREHGLGVDWNGDLTRSIRAFEQVTTN